MKKYHVTYHCDFHPDGIEADAVPPGDGAASAVIIVSIAASEPDGTTSTIFISRDGRTGEEVSDDEFFKAWALLAHRLSRSPSLGPGKRAFCAVVHEGVRKGLLSARSEAEGRPVTVSEPTVHILNGGWAYCGIPGLPVDWPPGHVWVSFVDPDVARANCAECLRRVALGSIEN
jgi:hypothetical protein